MSNTITKFRNGSALLSAGGHRRSGDLPYKDQANKRKCGQADTGTLSGYLDYWLENHAALRCQPKTLERYRQLAEYLTRFLGEVPMLELRPGLIQDAVNELQLRGGVATQAHPEGRPLAAKTVHSTASLLFTCLADATRLEHIPANPMACRKVSLPKRQKANPAVLDAKAICTVFETAAGTRLYPLVVTAASSGCRRGELLALTWADLDIEKGLMRVSKSVEQTRSGLRVKSTKSGRPRSIGLDDFTLDVLAEHRERQRQERAGHGTRYRDRDLIFCQPNGDFYSPDHVGTRTKALLRKAGYPECSLQSLRHSHASLLLGNGTPLAVVSERLGHANQNTTLQVYSHCLPGDRRIAASVWQRVLSNADFDECTRLAYTMRMKNITLSADEDLIERAQRRARAENATLNNLFREWLASYADRGSLSRGGIGQAAQAVEQFRAGQRFTRDERNER